MFRTRDLHFYWTVVELGMPMVDLARKFNIRLPVLAIQFSEKRKWQRNGVIDWKLDLLEYRIVLFLRSLFTIKSKKIYG